MEQLRLTGPQEGQPQASMINTIIGGHGAREHDGDEEAMKRQRTEKLITFTKEDA